MKTSLLSVALCCIAGFTTKGQVAQQGNLAIGPTNATSTVIGVGPHSRTWSNAQGGNPIIELATGMNFWSGQTWVPSNPSFQVSADGTAFVADQVQHKVNLGANLNTIGAVTVITPDGITLQSTPVAIGLYDAASGNSLIIGAITNCAGVLVSSNQVIYQGAFAGVSADIVYKLEQGSFRQDAVLTANINPADYGFPATTTRIQILTEFYNSPQPDEIVHPIYVEKNQTIRNSMVTPDLVDHTLGFGEFVLASGKAYTVGTTNVSASAPVAKEFTTILGRTFLIESVECRSIQRGLNTLPRQNGQVVKFNARPSKIGYASIPKAGTLQKSAAFKVSRQMTLAVAKRAGVVIDYIGTIGGTLDSSYVFKGDTTYFVSGSVSCPGSVTIEGNAVFKYVPGASIEIESSLTCQTANYRPAIFTAADDNSVGDTISTNIWAGYTGTVQSGGYANPALLFDSAPGTAILSNLRFSYAQQGVCIGTVGGGSSMTIVHSQFINCVEGIALAVGSEATITAYDCLFANNGNVIMDDAGEDTYYLSSCTVDNSSQPVSNTDGNSLYATNSVFSNIGDWVDLSLGGSYNGFYNSPQFGDNQFSSGFPFKVVAAGNYYLTNGSAFRGVGTTPLDSSLQARTTYPPAVYSNTIASTNIALATQVQRDTGSYPDLGYHYDPIDYLVDLFTITNATITVTNGVAIACYNDSGVVLKDGASINMTGTPLAPNWFVRFSSVQEQSLSLGAHGPSLGISVNPSPSGSLGPYGQYRFTKFACPAGGGYHLYDSGSQSYSNLYVRDCEFYSGTNYLSGPTNSATAFLKNNLFQRSSVFASNSNPQFSLTLSNNLVLGTYVTLSQPSNGVWYAFNNDFDSCNISTSCWLTNAYNGYINSTNRLYPTITGDVVTNSLTYQAGPLGNYYQPTNSPLIKAGSTTAGQAGLYHHTVTTNQIVEGTNIVSIGYHYMALNSNGIPIDTDGDGIPDYIEDSNGNGIYDAGDLSDWTDFYNGVLPNVTIVSGNNQVGMIGTYLQLPLIVSVAATNGINLTNAPITFAVTLGGAQVATATNATPAISVGVRTDTNGQASVFVLLPSTFNTTNYITATAWIGIHSNQVTFTAITVQGVTLWLRADAAITNGATNAVSSWGDQSGNGNNAWAPSAIYEPLLITNVINGKPVVRFNGGNVNEYLNLTNFLTGVTQAEAFVVLAAATNLPSGDRGLWLMGATGGVYPSHSGGWISDGFGRSDIAQMFVPPQPLNQFHLFNVSSQTGQWICRINGQLFCIASNSAVTFTSTPRLGQNGVPNYFAGDIAEVLLFNRALTDSERDNMGTYLNQKYAWISYPPATPIGLCATALATNQVALSWTNSLTNQVTVYTIQRKTGAGGSYAQIASVRDSFSYIDTNTVASTLYYYRVQAWNYAGASAYSSEVSVTTPGSGGGIPLGNLSAWLRGGEGIMRSTNGYVIEWLDQSSAGNNATNYPSNAPQSIGSSISFGDGNHWFHLAKSLTNLAQAEVYAVVQAASNLPPFNYGLWELGSGGNLYPSDAYNGGWIEEDFGRSVYVNPGGTGEGIPAQPLNQLHLYSVSSQAGLWSSRINGKVFYTDANTNIAFANDPHIGNNSVSSADYFRGNINEIMLFNRVLTDDERDGVGAYLSQKYNLLSSAPPTPTGLSVQAVATDQLSLWWSGAVGNQTVVYLVQRKLGVGGSYSQIAKVRDGTSYVDTNLVAGTLYYYKVSAWNYAGQSGYSSEANTTTLTNGASLPLSDLKLWLKADSGVTLDNTNGTVNVWLDQSGNTNNALVRYSTQQSQPLYVTNALNGGPLLRFSALPRLYLPNFMTNFTQSEVYAVLKAASALPSANSGLWYFGAGGGFYPSSLANGGWIYEGFGRSDDVKLGVPAQHLDQYHLYNVSSQVSLWRAWINGQLIFTTNGITVAFPSSPGLGQNNLSGSGGDDYFNGDLVEILVFDRVLLQEERDGVNTYLNGKYAVVTAAPPVPGGLLATGVAPSQIAISWTNTLVTNTVTFTIQRKTGSNGVYSQVGYVRDTNTFVDSTVVPGTNYYYRVKSWDFNGQSAYSSEISPPAASITNPLPQRVFSSGTNISLNAIASDSDGSVTQVVFFTNGVAFSTNSSAPYSAGLTNLSVGVYSVLAKATDNQGNSSFAAAESFVISPDTDGDGINDFAEILNGTDPTNSGDPPSPPANDHTAPVIVLIEPPNAVPL